MTQNTMIPFGKYKGHDLLYVAEINPFYLLWLQSVAKGNFKVSIDNFLTTSYFKDCIKEWTVNNEMEYNDYEPYAFDYMWK